MNQFKINVFSSESLLKQKREFDYLYKILTRELSLCVNLCGTLCTYNERYTCLGDLALNRCTKDDYKASYVYVATITKLHYYIGLDFFHYKIIKAYTTSQIIISS